jgi:hypothetical protein
MVLIAFMISLGGGMGEQGGFAKVFFPALTRMLFMYNFSNTLVHPVHSVQIIKI